MYSVYEIEKELQKNLEKEDTVGEVAGIILDFASRYSGIVPMKIIYSECCKEYCRDYNRSYFISVIESKYTTFKNPDDGREKFVIIEE